MKKLFLLFVASMLTMTGAKAEDVPSTLVATLCHDKQLQVFYGENALSEAYTAAVDGDVITLSAGRFNSVDIDKSITVRGAGMVADAKTDNAPTYLNNGFTVKLKEDASKFTLEGVYCCESVSITEESSTPLIANVSKCYFYKGLFLSANTYGKISHCIVYGHGNPPIDSSYDLNYLEIRQGICINCVLKVHSESSPSPVTFQNCVIRKYDDSYRGNYVSFFKSDDILTNCLILGGGSKRFNSETNIHSCVGVCIGGNDVDFFENVTNNSNKMVSDKDNFFKDSSFMEETYNTYHFYFSGLNIDGTGLYELSDEAANIYKGNDGTVVGVWGGTTPFDITPSNPRLTKCDIVPKVGSDGKLKVTIEVAQ